MRVTLLLLLLALTARGTTYYVDATGGNNAAAGTSPGTAWQTVAKVNGSTFSPGDTVHFKRGEAWPERLTVPSSGASGNYLHFTAYGTGALPSFQAASGRPECVSIPPGRTYVKISLLYMHGGDITQADGLLESDSITNVVEDCTLDAEDLADNCIGGSVTARRCLIQNARDDGFTMHATNTSLVENCTFIGNRSAMNNSGTGMSMTVNDCIFSENGDGVSSSFGDINGMSIGTFEFNRCDFQGRAGGGQHGFVTTTGTGENVAFNYCRFDNRSSSSASSGNIAISAGSQSEFQNCVFVGGASADRGNISGNTGVFTAVNCIFYNVWRLKATAPGTVNLSNCIVFNTGGIDAPGEHVYTNNVNGISSNPMFTNFSAGNFTLQASSPAINAGQHLGIPLDLLKNTVSNPPEIGAYEFEPPPPTPDPPRAYKLQSMRRPGWRGAGTGSAMIGSAQIGSSFVIQ